MEKKTKNIMLINLDRFLVRMRYYDFTVTSRIKF